MMRRIATIDRQWIANARAIMSATGCLAVAVLVLLPKWNSSPSLVHVRAWGVPWTGVSTALVITALLMASPRMRAAGYAIACFLELITAYSLAETSTGYPHANGPVIVFCFETAAFHFLGTLTARQDRNETRGGA